MQSPQSGGVCLVSVIADIAQHRYLLKLACLFIAPGSMAKRNTNKPAIVLQYK